MALPDPASLFSCLCAAKVRRIGILTRFDDAAPDGTGAGEIGVQLITVYIVIAPMFYLLPDAAVSPR